MKPMSQRLIPLLFWGLMALAFYFRASGLFHGLEQGHVFHPDTPKQVLNLQQGLEGNHITYHRSLFYDGYPYGLNRVDEVILRTLRGIHGAGYRLLHGNSQPLPIPSRATLFYHARLLRLLYGMIAVGLLVKSTALITRSPFATLCVLALYAVAPLASTVTHSASGDIGIDLFLSLALFFLALHVRTPKTAFLFAAGLAIGMAFASKYQGALGAWGVAVYLLVLYPPLQKPHTARFFKTGILSATGFFLGAFLLTPGLWIDPSTTWRYMRRNFEFIKNYGVPPDFLALPIHTRALTGLTNNLPVVVQALGPFLILATAISLILALRKPLHPPNPAERAIKGLWIGSASFPFLVILLSTAMKPMVQPFHFSFLLVPLIFSAGLLFHAMQASTKRPLILPACIWTLVIFVSSGIIAIRENTLWRNPSIVPLYNRYATHATRQPLHISRDFSRTDDVKTFHLHPPGLPVFRNQSRILSSPHAAWWQTHQQLPVPSRPLTDHVPGWIFLHGARFPNSDHAFRLPGGESHHVHLVHHQTPPEILHLGIRSGAHPLNLQGHIGPSRVAVSLPPHQQKILTIPLPPPHQVYPATQIHPSISVHQLHLNAAPGDAWIELIPEPSHLDHYQTFGPRPPHAPAPLDADATRVLADTRFLDSNIPEAVKSPKHHLFSTPQGLPAGSYRLQATLLNQDTQPAPLQFTLGDPLIPNPDFQSPSFTAPPGLSTHEHTFHKPFAPFEVQLTLLSESPNLTLLSWDLSPEPVQNIAESTTRPPIAFYPMQMRYTPGIHLTGFHLQLPETPGQPLTWAVKAEITPDLSRKRFTESVIFIHLLRSDGSIYQALDIPLAHASFSPDRLQRHQALPAPGLESLEELNVHIGLYNPRTRLRLTPRVQEPEQAHISRQALRLHTFTAPLPGQRLPHRLQRE